MTEGYRPCECKDVEFGSYERYVELVPPDFLKRSDGRGICVDVCLAVEISRLWREGVRTNGCCCGHNRMAPAISVADTELEKMHRLGYDQFPHPTNPAIFYAKSRRLP